MGGGHGMTASTPGGPNSGIEALESMILDRLSSLPEGAEQLVDDALPLLARMPAEEREALAALMIEGLADADLPETAWRLVETAGAWLGDAALSRRRLAEIARAAITGSRADVAALVEASGLAADRSPVGQAVQRLRKLRAFAPGVVCRHPSWGFGVVREVFALQGEVEVDFESKPGHLLQLRFAADSIDVFPPGHVLSRSMLDLDALRQDAERDPGGLLRECLRDAGGMLNAGEIADWLKGRVVPEDAWSRWWTAARAAAREDPHIVVPRKRSDAWHLSDTAVGPAEGFDRSIREARDAYETLVILDGFLKSHGHAFSPERRETVRALVAQRVQSGLSARDMAMAVLLADAGVFPQEDVSAAARALLDPPRLIEAAETVAAARFVRTVERLWLLDPGPARQALCAALNRLPARTLNGVIPFLVERLPRHEVGEMLARHIGEGSVDAEVLIWVVSDAARAEDLGIRINPLIARRALAAIERPHAGIRRRAQKDLAELLTNQEILEPLIRDASPAEIETLVGSIRKSEVLGVLVQRSLLAAFVKIRPEAADLLASGPQRSSSPVAVDVCSVRTHRRLQCELQRIVEVEIPANSREIHDALSHGDLRENHQYEAAKEHQAVLSRRREELLRLLNRLHPSDFAGVPTDRVRPGTSVVLRIPGGEERRVHVLGIHDSHPDRGAVAADTPMGQVLMSRRPGDPVALPAEKGTTVAEVASIGPLPTDLADWLARLD